MSKLRQQLDLSAADAPINTEPLGDLKPYVIFTQIKSKGPHIYAGWLEAADDEMAVMLAKEHYGQDQACVNIWAISREHIASSDGLYVLREAGGSNAWVVFTQKKRGDVFLEAGEVRADSPDAAVKATREAKPQAARAHCLWAVPKERILSTKPDDMIWRSTDQTYRLARGYTKSVKEKWQLFRGEDELAAYEKDDLKEAF